MSDWVSNTEKGNENNVYISFDVEADGPSPAMNSMVSIGLHAFNGKGEEVGTFQRNITPHSSRVVDNDTKVEFWDKNPEALAFVQSDQVSAEECMRDLTGFYDDLKAKGYKVKWMARPAAYDWQWLNTYYHEFRPAGHKKIGFKAQCISTLMWVYCEQNPDYGDYDALMKELTEGLEMTHNPLDDARYQSKMAFNLCERLHMRL